MPSVGNTVASFFDGIGNGLGYSFILIIVGFFRELFGSGKEAQQALRLALTRSAPKVTATLR